MYAAIDLGTSKVAVGVKTKDSLFFAQRASQGIKNGRVTSFEMLEEPLLGAIYEVEKESRLILEKVYVSVPMMCAQSAHCVAQIHTGGKPVTVSHLRALFTQEVDITQEIIHIFPKSYQLDENQNIKDPLGMIGDLLTANLHIVSVPKVYLKNLRHLIGRCHLDIEAFILAPYASSLSVLTDEELEVGVSLIDMGAGTTSFCSFYESQLYYAGGVSLGGVNITQDIACAFGFSFSEAERLKILHGALYSPIESQENSDYDLSHIIHARVEEILEMILQQGEKYLSNRLVLCGGASQLYGLEQELNQGWRVRTVNPKQGAPFTTLIGLLHYAEQDQTGQQWNALFVKDKGLWGKILNYFTKK